MAKKPAIPAKITETRYANFDALFEEFLEAQPGRGPVNRFAKFVEIEPNYITQIRRRNKGIGDVNAAKLAKAFGKPRGWMDIEHPWWEPRNPGERLYIQTAMSLIRDVDEIYHQEILDALRKLFDRYRRQD